MSTSELSDLSSALSSEDDNIINSVRAGIKIDHYLDKVSGAEKDSLPVKKKRSPSPPHEYVLADNPDIAVSYERSFSSGACNGRLSDQNRVPYASII